MSNQPDPRAVAAAKAVIGETIGYGFDEIEEAEAHATTLIAAEYAPLREAAKRALWVVEHEGQDDIAEELRAAIGEEK